VVHQNRVQSEPARRHKTPNLGIDRGPPQEIATQQRHCERAYKSLQQAERSEREDQGIAQRPEQHVDRT
jgi:hypothetical protein